MKDRWLKISVLVVVVIMTWYFLPRVAKSPQSLIHDYASCIAEPKSQFIETFPPQCIAPDGSIFTEEDQYESEVVISTPKIGQLVSSPLQIQGKARGNWFFEGQIPATLKDQAGNVLVKKALQAQGNWMTDNYVDFSGILEFQVPQEEYGVLIIERDNPSGLPEFDASFAVPVRFR